MYAVLGFECTNLEVQKLAYFLQRVIEGLGLDNPLRLRFSPNKYGPYADALRHLLDALDGSYLHCQKRLHDAGPLDPIQLDLERLERVKAYVSKAPASAYREALQRLDALIDGFQSPYLMELLSSVDWLLVARAGSVTESEVLSGLQNWPGGATAGRRKARLFRPDVVRLALDRLNANAQLLYPQRAS